MHVMLLSVFRGVPVPTACKLRPERMHAIGEALSKADYDIVLLQEVCDVLTVISSKFVSKSSQCNSASDKVYGFLSSRLM